MKQLKFAPNLVPLILSGQKTSTWRLFDDKNLSVGDELEFINKETGEQFGRAIVESIKEKTFDRLEAIDWIGHEQYRDSDQMYSTYRGYYDDSIGPDSPVMIIAFRFYKDV